MTGFSLPSCVDWVSEPRMAGMTEETTTGTPNWYCRRLVMSMRFQPRLGAVTRPESSTLPEVVTPTETRRRSRPVIRRFMPAMMCSMTSPSLSREMGVATSSSHRVRPLVS